MDETTCVVCGKATRVPHNTPRVEQTCADHQGKVTESVAVLRYYLDPYELAAAVESRAARAAISFLDHAASEFETAARANEQQITQQRDRFDRDRAAEFKGEYRARLECARVLRRIISELRALAPLITEDQPPT